MIEKELSESEKKALRLESLKKAKENDKSILKEMEKKVIKPVKNALRNRLDLWLLLNKFETDIENAKKQYPGKSSEYHSNYGSEENSDQSDENFEDPKSFPTPVKNIEASQILTSVNQNSEISQKSCQDQNQNQNQDQKPPFNITKRPSIRYEMSKSVRDELEELKKSKRIDAYYASKKNQKPLDSGQ